jgi:hypothetical protein
MADSQLAKRTPLSSDPVGAIVGEFVEEKRREIKEEKARLAPKRRSPFVLPLLIVLCALVWISPSLMPPLEPALAPEVLERGARLNLYLASLRVRQYQAQHRRLPADLVQAGVDTTGITYSHNNSVFELSTHVLGSKMVYRSTQPDSLFLGADRVKGIR